MPKASCVSRDSLNTYIQGFMCSMRHNLLSMSRDSYVPCDIVWIPTPRASCVLSDVVIVIRRCCTVHQEVFRISQVLVQQIIDKSWSTNKKFLTSTQIHMNQIFLCIHKSFISILWLSIYKNLDFSRTHMVNISTSRKFLKKFDKWEFIRKSIKIYIYIKIYTCTFNNDRIAQWINASDFGLNYDQLK